MFLEIYTAAMEATWAISETALANMLAAARAFELPQDQAARRKLPKVNGTVATLPLWGVISQKASIWQEAFGGTSTEAFGAAFSGAVKDDRIKAIVIDVDSPGGTTAGVSELADIIHAGSQRKPVAAIANSQMASAAYWLASQVGHGKQSLIAAPGADVGSIGVFRVHEDVSEQLAADGIKVTLLSIPRYKTEASPFEPLSDAAIEHHMGQVQATYDQFVAAVARGRGVNARVVRDGFGEGRMFHAQQAADMGLVDRVATVDQLFSELGVQTDGLSMAEQLVATDELCHEWETASLDILQRRADLIWKKS